MKDTSDQKDLLDDTPFCNVCESMKLFDDESQMFYCPNKFCPSFLFGFEKEMAEKMLELKKRINILNRRDKNLLQKIENTNLYLRIIKQQCDILLAETFERK